MPRYCAHAFTLHIKFPLPPGLLFTASFLFLPGHHVVGQAPSPSISHWVEPNSNGLNPDFSAAPQVRDWSPEPIYLLPSTYIPVAVAEPSPEPQIDPVAPIVISSPDPSPAPSLSPGSAVRALVDVPPVQMPPEAQVERITPVPVPTPNPLPSLPPPLVPPTASFASGPPYLQRLARAIPRVQLWRAESNIPQNVVRRRGRFESLLVTGNEPVTLHLFFPRSLAGQTIEVLADDSFTAPPAASFLLIGPTGETGFVVELAAARSRGEIALRVDSITTTLDFLRAPLGALLAKERASGGTGQ